MALNQTENEHAIGLDGVRQVLWANFPYRS